MLSAKFSKKSASKSTACVVKLYPGPPPGGQQHCHEESQGNESSCAHKQEGDSKVETITPLGRTESEKEACLFPNSSSDSDLNSISSMTMPATTVMLDDGLRNPCMSGFSRSSSSSIAVNTSVGLSSATFPLKAPTVSADQCTSNSTISSEFPSSVLSDKLKVQLPPSSSMPSVSKKSDFSEMDIRLVPAKALNVPTRTRLSLMLNPSKVRRNDWTGLASEMGFEYEMIENIAMERDPMKTVIAQWTCKQDSTIGALLDMLKDLERDDVLLDITKLAGELMLCSR